MCTPVSHQATQGGHGRQAGQAMTEMALVMVMLVPLFIGSVDLGRAYFAYDLLVHAVNEGARRASVDSTSINVVADTRTAGGTLNLQVGDVTVTCYGGSTTTTKTCASMVLGDSVRVSATSSFVPATPWLSRLLPGGTITLWAAAQRTYQ
jgi:Flp pilus assembly protein TadG